MSGTLSAQDVQECVDAQKAATYCGKIAAELAHGWVKAGRKTGSTSVHAFAIAAKGVMRDLKVPGLDRVSRKRCRELWGEYAAAMKGVRLGVVSHHLARKLGIQAASDEEKPGLRQLLEDERVGTIPSMAWDELVKRGLAGDLLARVESEVALVDIDDDVEPEYVGWDGVLDWVADVTGIAVREPTEEDEEFLRPCPPLHPAPPPTPEENAARERGDALMRRVVSMRIANAVSDAGSMRARDAIRCAIHAASIIEPAAWVPDEGDVVRAMARAA
ncbi:MAG: hypothetical protein AB1592_03885 [Pseudomonadota bacterium]